MYDRSSSTPRNPKLLIYINKNEIVLDADLLFEYFLV